MINYQYLWVELIFPFLSSHRILQILTLCGTYHYVLKRADYISVCSINFEFLESKDNECLIHAWYIIDTYSIFCKLINKSHLNPKYFIQVIGTYQVLSKYTNFILHKPLLLGSELCGSPLNESQVCFFHLLVLSLTQSPICNIAACHWPSSLWMATRL